MCMSVCVYSCVYTTMNAFNSCVDISVHVMYMRTYIYGRVHHVSRNDLFVSTESLLQNMLLLVALFLHVTAFFGTNLQ